MPITPNTSGIPSRATSKYLVDTPSGRKTKRRSKRNSKRK